MKKHAAITIFMLIALAGVVEAQVYENETTLTIDDLEYYVATDRDTYFQGDSVYLITGITNLGEDSLTLHFSSAQEFDFWVGSWWWSNGNFFPAIYWEVHIAPGGAYYGEYAWDMIDHDGELASPGVYSVYGTLACWEALPFEFLPNVIIRIESLERVDKPAVTKIPEVYELLRNHPNPFNPTTTIYYTLPNPQYVMITVYDVTGRKVQTLVDSWQAAEEQQVLFDGGSLTSGVYFYQLVAGDRVVTRKMLLIK